MESAAVSDEISSVQEKIEVFSVQQLESAHFKCAHLETFQ